MVKSRYMTSNNLWGGPRPHALPPFMVSSQICSVSPWSWIRQIGTSQKSTKTINHVTRNCMPKHYSRKLARMYQHVQLGCPKSSKNWLNAHSVPQSIDLCRMCQSTSRPAACRNWCIASRVVVGFMSNGWRLCCPGNRFPGGVTETGEGYLPMSLSCKENRQ